MNSTRLFALCDIKDDPRKRWGAFEVSEQRARQLNKEGFGIFFTPNEFEGKRQIQNLKRINYYIADIDEGGKEKIWQEVGKLILRPSVIVETKRGYHLYWRVSDGTLGNYEKIENCIIKKLNADRGAKDCSRLLRCPSFYHMKDPENPFLIKIIEENDRIYKENELYLYFKGQEKRYRPIRVERQRHIFQTISDFKDDNQMLKHFCFHYNTNERHNELLNKIGIMRREGFGQADREQMIWFMNSRFTIPLPEEEVRLILKTTVYGKKGER